MSSRLFRTLLTAVCLGSAVLAAPASTVAVAHGDRGEHHGGPGGSVEGDLRTARQATRQFRDLAAAEAAGYQRSSDCESDPKYGAMGYHYANPDLVADGVLDLAQPEVLVYQRDRDGRLRLGAIEYFEPDADQDLATDPDRPWLFQVPFDGPMLGHDPDMPVHYDLHVWLYRHNPAGIFAMWNPQVTCP
jgi:hypothetical protein